MNIEVNGERRDVPDPISLIELVDHLNLASERLAIELNHTVVRRRDWPQTYIAENDRVEIVHFVGGGDPRQL